MQPSDPQRFAIRLLLHRKGVTSFEDPRTIDGQLHDTFKDAARAMGLLEDDTEHRRCLQEAAVMNMPSQMRQLFATLMVFQTPSDIRALFDEFKEAMCEDYIRHDQLYDPETTLQERHIHLCLWDINTCLRVCKAHNGFRSNALPVLRVRRYTANKQLQTVTELEMWFAK